MVKPQDLPCKSSQEMITVYQFETTETPYKKVDSSGKVIDKISKRTEKVPHKISYEELYNNLVELKKKYTMHKYQVYNDIFHWKSILNTSTDGPIYHMDYSENLTQMHKEEAQSSHFNKAQYTLHCTVQHNTDKENDNIYHLSDEKNMILLSHP